MQSKIEKFKDRFVNIDDEYGNSRGTNDDLLRKNQQLKNEIVEIEDKIQVERDKQFQLRATKDKANHNVYKTVSESEEQRC